LFIEKELEYWKTSLPGPAHSNSACRTISGLAQTSLAWNWSWTLAKPTRHQGAKATMQRVPRPHRVPTGPLPFTVYRPCPWILPHRYHPPFFDPANGFPPPHILCTAPVMKPKSVSPSAPRAPLLSSPMGSATACCHIELPSTAVFMCHHHPETTLPLSPEPTTVTSSSSLATFRPGHESSSSLNHAFVCHPPPIAPP
jgi:hypothetical protein